MGGLGGEEGKPQSVRKNKNKNKHKQQQKLAPGLLEKSLIHLLIQKPFNKPQVSDTAGLVGRAEDLCNIL